MHIFCRGDEGAQTTMASPKVLHNANFSTLTLSLHKATVFTRELYMCLISSGDLPTNNKSSADGMCVRCLAESAALLGVLPRPARGAHTLAVAVRRTPVQTQHQGSRST